MLGPADVDVSENYVLSLLLHKNIFSFENYWRKCFENFFFPVPTMVRKGTLPGNVLKMLSPGHILLTLWHHYFTLATMHITDADVAFCDGLGKLTFKTAKQVYINTWIALLKHGFGLVKTWMLIACSTGFYAIIYGKTTPSKWAMTWQNQQNECSPSLIRVFTVHMKQQHLIIYDTVWKHKIAGYPTCN